ncbi:hypothetical protein ABZW47_20125 [Streptomyces sp. NPDC004549]|uniref:hypothetical protein n=1 Tax=Streptomyces sp. NPDC004549 TaxID=3154283 RepID=UPI0033B2DB7C
MTVRRVVPVIHSESLRESRDFYGSLGFEEVMNHGWILTLASPAHPAAQVSVVTEDATAPVVRDPNGRVVNVLSHRRTPDA